MPLTKNIAVIGAGIAGVTIAYQLARLGYNVTVFDKERYPAMQTSYANGSQLSVCNSQTWNTWSTISKGLTWLFKQDAPLYISPKIDLEKIKWLSKFICTTAYNRHVQNTTATIKLALESRKETLDIAFKEDIKFDHVNKGILHIYTDRKSFNDAFKAESLMTSNGCEWDILDPQACIMKEPALSSNPNLIGGVLTSSDSTGDMNMFINGLVNVCIAKYNVAFRFEQNITDINVSNHGVVINDSSFDHVVIAAGVDSNRWGCKFGDNLGIYPVKGYSITVDLLDTRSQSTAPWTSLLDEGTKIVCSRLGATRLRVAGTAELSGYNLDIKQNRIKPLLDWTQHWFPNVDTRSYRPWTGLRPMTPNMMPIVGRGKHRRVWYHTGHGHLGWTLSAATAKNLALQIYLT